MRKRTYRIMILFLSTILSTVNFALADGELATSFEITGHYDMVAAGVSLRNASGNLSWGDIQLDVPGIPRAAFLYWSGFDANPGGDEIVQLSRDSEAPVILVADSQSGPDLWWIQLSTFHYVYRKDITSFVRQGMHSYHFSDFNIRYHYGAGILVVYEDPSLPVNNVTIKDGLDAAYWDYDPPRGPNTEVTSIPVQPAGFDRTLSYLVMVGGIIDNSRLNSIWTLSGMGSVPTNLVDFPVALETGPLPSPLGITPPDHCEWDVYSNDITVYGGSTFAAFQIESVADVSGYLGASFNWIVLGGVFEAASTQYASIGDFVWDDENKNGLQDPGEEGIQEVTVRLLNTSDLSIVDIKTTDGNGYYLFTDVAPGDYILDFVPPVDYFFTSRDEGSDDELDSDPNQASGRTAAFSVSAGDVFTCWDAGLVAKVVSDLEIIKQVDREFVRIGDEVIFTLIVVNHGPDLAMGVQVIDDLPQGLEFIDAIPPQASGPNPLVWIFDLPPEIPNNRTEIQIRARTTTFLGGMDNNAFVSCENRDPDMSNNTGSAQIHNFVAVELARFSAFSRDGQIVLEWTTESESENLGFNIFRSKNEEGPYEKVTKMIKGAGNSQVSKKYTYIDRDVLIGQSYHYQLQDVNFDGESTMHGPVFAFVSAPKDYELKQNFPNPFNPSTNIQFTIQKSGFCELVIYNVQGQAVRKLVSEFLSAGSFSVEWDGKNQTGHIAPSGVYFYRIHINGYAETKKMGFLR
ncbi:DUF11 domain-containing protein [candidate division KSB1 bacterium]|nr:DUF11 domain-containing protein [candidate division KSB1 bacterium]